MKRIRNLAVMKQDSYNSPQMSLLDFIPEGFLCASYSSADDFYIGPALGENDYEQIF